MNISMKLYNKLQKEELSDIYKIDTNKDGLKIIFLPVLGL